MHDGIRELPIDYAKFDESYADYKKIEPVNNCPICNNEKYVKQKFCSHKCAQTNSRKVDWDKIDLLDLMSKHSIGTLEEMLGVSNAAIYKRRKKIFKKE